MDIKKIISKIPKDSREVLQNAVDNYFRTSDTKYAKVALAILENFEEDSDIKELVKVLKK